MDDYGCRMFYMVRHAAYKILSPKASLSWSRKSHGISRRVHFVGRLGRNLCPLSPCTGPAKSSKTKTSPDAPDAAGKGWRVVFGCTWMIMDDHGWWRTSCWIMQDHERSWEYICFYLLWFVWMCLDKVWLILIDID